MMKFKVWEGNVTQVVEKLSEFRDTFAAGGVTLSAVARDYVFERVVNSDGHVVVVRFIVFEVGISDDMDCSLINYKLFQNVINYLQDMGSVDFAQTRTLYSYYTIYDALCFIFEYLEKRYPVHTDMSNSDRADDLINIMQSLNVNGLQVDPEVSFKLNFNPIRDDHAQLAVELVKFVTNLTYIREDTLFGLIKKYIKQIYLDLNDVSSLAKAFLSEVNVQ